MITRRNASALDASSPKCHGTAGRRSAAKSAKNGPCKIVLPRRPGEPKFAPPQYYCPASRSGVIPTGRFAA
jgi:hypothetical protein